MKCYLDIKKYLQRNTGPLKSSRVNAGRQDPGGRVHDFCDEEF